MTSAPRSRATPRRAWTVTGLALVAWAALLLQLVLSVRQSIDNGLTAVDGLIAYAGYFTVLTNGLVALMATAGALRRGRPAMFGAYGPLIVGGVTASIALVGIAYHLLLRHVWSPQGAQWLADVLLHYVVPIVALLHWLGYRGAAAVPFGATLRWCAWPALYLAYALLRGEWLHRYPYPFIDVDALGWARVSFNAFGLLIAFLVIGSGVVALGRWRDARDARSARGAARATTSA